MIPDINDQLKPRPRKYRNIIKHISPYLLATNTDDDPLSSKDVFIDLSTSRGTERFLGTFTQKGMEFVLERFGVISHLTNTGLKNTSCKLNTDDPYLHKISVRHNINGKSYLSGELSMRKTSMDFPNVDRPYTLLLVEWFLLQHPLKSFSRKRPQLPGQNHPGLGISELIFELFYWTARRLEVDGVVLVPNFLHTGLLYGRQFLFIDPVRQGELYSLDKIRKYHSLDQLSWACAEGQLIDVKKQDRYLWVPAPMVLPVSRKLKDYFHRHNYVETVRQTKNTFRVKINKGYKKSYSSSWMSL